MYQGINIFVLGILACLRGATMISEHMEERRGGGGVLTQFVSIPEVISLPETGLYPSRGVY